MHARVRTECAPSLHRRSLAEMVPSLPVSGVELNGQKTGDLRAGPGQVYAVMVGLPAKPLALPFGNVWLVLVGTTGTTGESGTATWSNPAPTQAVLIGEVFTWQGGESGRRCSREHI